jgi:putative FmdB family regulatory protein
MPLYEYKCQNCGKTTELLHSIKATFEEILESVNCCNFPLLDRKISINTFQLRGGGWEKDNYCKKSGEKK